MGKGPKKDRGRIPAAPRVERPTVWVVPGPPADRSGEPGSESGGPGGKAARKSAKAAHKAAKAARGRDDRGAVATASPYAHAVALTGAKKAKGKCCRSTPRCKGCPVVLMRAARAQEAGLTGKDLKKAVKRARAA